MIRISIKLSLSVDHDTYPTSIREYLTSIIFEKYEMRNQSKVSVHHGLQVIFLLKKPHFCDKCNQLRGLISPPDRISPEIKKNR